MSKEPPVKPADLSSLSVPAFLADGHGSPMFEEGRCLRCQCDVQIKLTAGNGVSMFADCMRLIVLRIVSPEQAEIVCDGPGAPAWGAAGTMQKNGQRKISLTKLRTISEWA